MKFRLQAPVLGRIITILVLTLISLNIFANLWSYPALAQTSSPNSAYFGDWINNAPNPRLLKATIGAGQQSTYSVQLFGDGNSTATSYPPADANPDGPTIYGHTLCATDNAGMASFLQFAITLSQDSSQLTAEIDLYRCVRVPVIVIGAAPALPALDAPSLVPDFHDPNYNSYSYVSSWTDTLVRPTSGPNPNTCDMRGPALSTTTPKILLEQGSSTSATLNVNYTTSDIRPLDVVLSTQLLSKPDSYDPSQHQLDYLLERDVFSINPNQVTSIDVSFVAKSSLPIGEYTVKVNSSARYGQCYADPSSLTFTVDVRKFVPRPDFTIRASMLEMTLDRGYSQEVTVILDALAGTKGSLTTHLSPNWKQDAQTPILVEQKLDRNDAFLYPSATVLDRLIVKANLDDKYVGQSGYLGRYVLTITATGTWNENGIEYPVAHTLEIPITIQDKVTEFQISSNVTRMSLTPAGKTIKLDVNLVSGPPRPVTLQIVGFYPDLVIKSEKKNGVPNFSSLMTIVPSQPFNGSRLVQIVASGGGKTHSLNLEMNMNSSKSTSSSSSSSTTSNPVIITIDSEPRLDGLIVDGRSLTAQDLQFLNAWQAGEMHQLKAASEIQIDQGKRYVFDGWSDGERSPTRTVEVSLLAMTIIGKYRPQYYLEINSAIGEPSGSGWYDEGTTARFSVLKTDPGGFGVNNIFNGWSGNSTQLIDQSCTGSPSIPSSNSTTTLNPDRVQGTICMNGAHTIIPVWKTDSSIQTSIIGGGLAAASIGGVVTALAKTGHLSNMLKGKRPKIPVLTWEVYAPESVVGNAPVYIDVVLKNMGEADAKNIRLELISDDLNCPPPHLIETLMPWEARRMSFAAIPRRSQPTYELKVLVQSKFIPKKEAMAVIVGTEIRYVPKKEKTISLDAKNLRICIFEKHASFKPAPLLDRLETKGLSIEMQRGASIDKLTEKYDVIILQSPSELEEKDVVLVRQFVMSGRGLIMLGALHEASNALASSIHNLLKLFGCEIENDFLEFEQPFAIRISDPDHPIIRGLNGGDTFRARGSRDKLLNVRPTSGRVVMEQWLSHPAGPERNAVVLPAIIANEEKVDTVQSIEPKGRAVFLNVQSDSNTLPEIMMRSLLWVGGVLNEKPKESE